MGTATPHGEAFADGNVRGFIHRPMGEFDTAIVLAHGAGSNANAPQLIQVAAAFCEAGVLALRIDLPFRQRRPKGPPHPSTAVADRQGLREAVATVRGIGAKRVILGGHSYGGRQASMLLSEDRSVAEALLLLSYPLHPPDQPAQLRVAHFPALQTSTLFVHGSRDPFATIAELRGAIAVIAGPVELVEVASAGHELRRMPLSEIVSRTLSLLTLC